GSAPCGDRLGMGALYPFFFQAGDGIRDGHVTGVQTCALPISQAVLSVLRLVPELNQKDAAASLAPMIEGLRRFGEEQTSRVRREIGRASCRERVCSGGVAGALAKKYLQARCR